MRFKILACVIFIFILSPFDLGAQENMDAFHQTLMTQAQKALAARDDAKAEGLLMKILEAYPEDQKTLRLASEVLSRQGKHREAAAIYSRILRLAPEDAETLIHLAQSRWQLKQGYEAQAALVRVLSQNNLTEEQKALARRTLAEIYDDWSVLNVMQQRNDYQAQDRFHTYHINKDPDGAGVSYALRGFARHWLRRPDEAKADFEKALDIGNLSADLTAGVKNSLAEIFKAEEDQRRAEEERQAAEERRAAAEQEAERERQRAEEERASAEASTPAGPPRINVYEYFDQIDRLLALGSAARAAGVLDKTRGLTLADEEKGIQLYYEGELAWRRGAFEQAAGYYHQAAKLIQERFRHSAALMRLAEFYGRHGNVSLAKSYARQSADLLSDQAWKFKQAAGFFMGLKQTETAVAYYKRALAIDPAPIRNRDTFMGLAEAYKLLNDEGNYHQYARLYLEAASAPKVKLTAAEEGMLYFYRAELSGPANKAAAYQDYYEASLLITEKYRLSEIYIKMAEHLAEVKDYDQAAHYATLSAATLPDQPWRNRQAAGVFDRIGRLDEAIYYTKLAMSQEPEGDLRADRDLAYLYLRNREKGNYLVSYEAYIDKLIAETDRLGAGAGYDLNKELYEARRSHSDSSRAWGFDSYNFGTRRKNGDYAVMTINELFVNFTLPTDTPGKVYHRLNATLTSHYSGVYRDPVTSREQSWSTRTNLEDSAYGILGVKVSPITAVPDFSLGFEYLYPIGRDRDDDDFRGRLEYNRTWGEKPRPYETEANWIYAKAFAELLYSTRHDDITAFGEMSFGRTFSPDFDKNFLVMPHLRANWSYSGEEAPKGQRWGLEAGPAISIRKWFNEDRYNAPKSYVELALQYTIGLSHELDNGVGFNLNFSF